MNEFSKQLKRGTALALVGLATLATWQQTDRQADARPVGQAFGPSEVHSYIVQASSSSEAISFVQAAGGTTGYELESTRGTEARLTRQAVEKLMALHPDLSISDNVSVELTGRKDRGNEAAALEYAHAPSMIGATELLASGISGRGVNVAILDTGLHGSKPTFRDTHEGEYRYVALYDVDGGLEETYGF